MKPDYIMIVCTEKRFSETRAKHLLFGDSVCMFMKTSLFLLNYHNPYKRTYVDILMVLKEVIYQALKEKNPEALNDIKMFHRWAVLESLRVTDPNSYTEQQQRLAVIECNYTGALASVIHDNFSVVLEHLLDKLADMRHETRSP